VAKYDVASKTWSALGSGVNATVNALATFSLLGDVVYVGGSFTTAGGITANRIARWFNNAWTAVGSGGGNGVNAVVTSLAYRSGNLFVGGGFNQANVGASITANYIARVNTNANTWNPVGSGGNGVNGVVHALWISESGDVYVGGDFTDANVGGSASISANRVARWGNGSWSSLGTGASNGVNGTVLAITGSASDVFVGGTFSNAGGVANTGQCARWSIGLSRWIAMGTPPNAGVEALAVSGSYVFAGGLFTQAGGNPAARLARWNGKAWSTVGASGGQGADARVRGLAVRAGRQIFIGGDFAQVNTGAPINVGQVAQWEADTSARVSGPNMALNYTITSASGTPTITFTNSAPPPSAIPTGISTVSQYFWTLTPNSTTFTQGFLETDVLSLAGVTGSPGALRILWRPTPTTAWTNLGSGFTNGTGNMLTHQTPITDGGQIAIGDAGGGNQLPVELSDFQATPHRDGVLLKWTTTTELNNSGFFVERRRKPLDASTTQPTWVSLDFVRGNGTTTTQTSYTFIDKSASGMVEYRLKQVDFDGTVDYSPIINFDAGLPKKYDLWQNYPNPFNPTTIIRYQLPTTSIVKLELYDVLGKKVAELFDGQQEAGAFEYQLDAAKLRLSSGVYFYRLQAGSASGGTPSFIQTKKMLLLK
jgi:hypothetical protein